MRLCILEVVSSSGASDEGEGGEYFLLNNVAFKSITNNLQKESLVCLTMIGGSHVYILHFCSPYLFSQNNAPRVVVLVVVLFC